MENTQGVIDHLKKHQQYPATKTELVAACNNLSDFSVQDKEEFASKLTKEMYNSAEDVMGELGITVPGM